MLPFCNSYVLWLLRCVQLRQETFTLHYATFCSSTKKITYRGRQRSQILRRNVAVAEWQTARHFSLFFQHRHGAVIRYAAHRVKNPLLSKLFFCVTLENTSLCTTRKSCLFPLFFFFYFLFSINPFRMTVASELMLCRRLTRLPRAGTCKRERESPQSGRVNCRTGPPAGQSGVELVVPVL